MKTTLRLLTLLLLTGLCTPPAHATPGDVDPLDAAVIGTYVTASAVQPDGKTIIAGSFSSVLGQPRNNIARLNADGTLDAGFNPNANGNVLSVAVQADGRILFGGGFTTVGGTVRNRIARLDAAGTLDTGFNPNANNVVRIVAVQADGRILLGGDFTTVGGTTRNRIARVNAAGALDAGFNPNANGDVISVAVETDGRILLGGSFSSVSGTARNNIARVDAAGTIDAGFNPNASAPVVSVAVEADGRILLGGLFITMGGTARNCIARVDAAGALDAGFNPNASNVVYSVVVQADGRILLGGEFTSVGGTGRNRIARVDAAGALDPGFNPNASYFVYSVAVQADGRVLLGGFFSSVGGTARNVFARLLNDPATQTLSAPDATQVTWTRGGSSLEVSQVAFEKSTDGGATWTPLGNGTRIGTTPNWQLAGLSLTGSGQLRARGRTSGGYLNGSSGLIEQVAAFSFDDDGDGVGTTDEDVNGNGNVLDDDTDGDGIADYLDPDDDDDGVPTSDELPISRDTDGDGIPNYRDDDDDADGVLTITEDVNANGNALDDDTDGDGLVNYLDQDDDDDGIPTVEEDLNSNGNYLDDDDDGDGTPDYLDADPLVVETTHSARFRQGSTVPGSGMNAYIPAGATWFSFGVPALNGQGKLAYIGKWKNPTGSAIGTYGTGLFVDGALKVSVGEGATTLPGVTFKAFKDPVIAADSEGIAFPATLAGSSVLPADDTSLWWQPASGALTLLAREGTAAVGGGTWKGFTSLALPGGATGPVFLGTLVQGSAGIDATKDVGVWAVDSTGALRLLFREGDTVDGKVVKSFALLKAVSGSPGASRAFNANAEISWRAVFTDGSSALMVTAVP